MLPSLFEHGFIFDPWGTRIELVEDPELIRVDLLALRAKALVAKQPHVLAQLRDLGVTGFELRVTRSQFRVPSFELDLALANQRAESFDRVRELLRDVHHDADGRPRSLRYKVDS